MGIFGSLLAGGLNYLGARSQNSANRAAAQKQMDFQENMSGTAYQRAMHDMEQAGLNPMLAYQQGGASSPAGTSIAQQNEIGPAVASAMDAKRTIAEVNNLKEQNSTIRSQKHLFDAQARQTRASARAIESKQAGLDLEENIDTNAMGLPSFGLKWLDRMIKSLSPIKFNSK